MPNRGLGMQPTIAYWVSAALIILSGTGCESEADDTVPVISTAVSKIQAVRLVDPQVWEAESDFFGANSGIQFRVEVTTGMRTDTVPEVLVLATPVVTPDSLSVSGVALGPHDIVQGIFSYHLADRTLEMNSNPGPGYTPYSEPSLSPNGTHLAYLANDRNYHFWLVLLSWPGCDVVVETPQVETRCTEFWGNALRWLGADSVELYMNLCDENRWARASGTIRPLRFGVDTVGLEDLEAMSRQSEQKSP